LKAFKLWSICLAGRLRAPRICLNALSKHKPVLIYENGRPVGGAKVAKKLKKAGIPEVYILKSGLNSWNGKTKSGI
ncbi:rhodanese-like domain-containing protein, partial [Lactococcus lactis]